MSHATETTPMEIISVVTGQAVIVSPGTLFVAVVDVKLRL
jgi:hypothetical protein